MQPHLLLGVYFKAALSSWIDTCGNIVFPQRNEMNLKLPAFR